MNTLSEKNRYPVSSTGAVLALDHPEEKVFEILAQCGLDCVDFWLFRYCKGAYTPMLETGWERWAEKIRRISAEYHLPIEQAHAQFNEFLPEDGSYQGPSELLLRNVRACRMFGCDRLIVHPVLTDTRIRTPEQRQHIMEYNLRWFSELLPIAEECQVEIHIENMFRIPAGAGRGDYQFPFNEAASLVWLAEKLQHPLVRICLDTGHANLCGYDIPAFIRTVREYLGTLHLNDNVGDISPHYADLHLFPGHGTIPWDQVAEVLKEIDYQGAFSMEALYPALRTMPTESFIELTKSAAEFVRLQLSLERNGQSV